MFTITNKVFSTDWKQGEESTYAYTAHYIEGKTRKVYKIKKIHL